MVETILGTVAAGLLIASLVSRFIETKRADDVTGLSASYLWLAFLLNIGWAAYGYYGNVPAQLYPSLLALLVLGYSLWRVHTSGRPQTRMLAPITVATIAMILTAQHNPDITGYVAGLLGASANIGQIHRVFSTQSRAGVAPLAWTFGLLLSLAWMAYGLAAGLTPVWTMNLLSAILCGLVLIGYKRAR